MPTIDEKYLKEKAEDVSEDDIQYVVEHSDEIKDSFIGRGPFGKFVEEIVLCLSMVVDYGRGRYRKIPFWAIGAIVFMLLYVANPVDVIPDFLIGIGQIDDIIVITLCLLMVRQELHEYKAWKLEQDDDID
ncbi:MAG: DUF1232 domain-containing protein [Candidatus Hydrogenedentota bacterium]